MTDFVSLLERAIAPPAAEDAQAVRIAIQALAEQALILRERQDALVVTSAWAILSEIDQALTRQLKTIMHHPDFLTLEGAWRGLHYLVSHTETNEMLKIRVMNVSRVELGATLKKYKGTAWDQSPIFAQVYSAEHGMLGGEPYQCLVGDYYFDHSPADVDLLRGMMQIAATSHAPFIASASPNVMGMASWQELGNPRDLTKIFSMVEYGAWRTLRETDESRWVFLTLPRFLARLPNDPWTNPLASFAFSENPLCDHSAFVWANAAYLMAVNIARAFTLHGWCSRIVGFEAGAFEELPEHRFYTDDGGFDVTCPTEIEISDRRARDLAKSGFVPLVHRKHSTYAAFTSDQSLHRPAQFDDPDATTDAACGARLSYLLAVGRFAHYLHVIARDRRHAFIAKGDLQAFLERWIAEYVDPDPEFSRDADKARRPLAAAKIRIDAVEDAPEHYAATYSLSPHYQLERLTHALRIEARLPSVG